MFAGVPRRKRGAVTLTVEFRIEVIRIVGEGVVESKRNPVFLRAGNHGDVIFFILINRPNPGLNEVRRPAGANRTAEVILKGFGQQHSVSRSD